MLFLFAHIFVILWCILFFSCNFQFILEMALALPSLYMSRNVLEFIFPPIGSPVDINGVNMIVLLSPTLASCTSAIWIKQWILILFVHYSRKIRECRCQGIGVRRARHELSVHLSRKESLRFNYHLWGTWLPETFKENLCVVGFMSFILYVDICFIFGDSYSGPISLFIILNFNYLFWNMLLLFSNKTLKIELFTKGKIHQIEHHHKEKLQIK